MLKNTITSYRVSVADQEEVDLDLPEDAEIDEVGQKRHDKLVLVLTARVVELQVQHGRNTAPALHQMVDVVEENVWHEVAIFGDVVPVPVEGHMTISRLQSGEMRLHQVVRGCNRLQRIIID